MVILTVLCAVFVLSVCLLEKYFVTTTFSCFEKLSKLCANLIRTNTVNFSYIMSLSSRGKTFQEGKMSYPEFVWFLMSEEDKKHPTRLVHKSS